MNMTDTPTTYWTARAVVEQIAGEMRLGRDQAGVLHSLLTHDRDGRGWVWKNGRITNRCIESLTRRGLLVDERPVRAVWARLVNELARRGNVDDAALIAERQGLTDAELNAVMPAAPTTTTTG
ncbi:hypothetical protein I5G67_gp091 [Mycobacterium phage Aminay]|uniref:Uncharacterized protein n=1 Tax=Mycobacterium phage Aminay TaxID=2250291 RepID=A0A345KV75_9CAUD|nr:hypothetical protein I5G67_gp091 [Mycobacterium phage Aminay]AXH46927.1 hypothetical protein SEA_AMINAY_91 [Mycobacterium phage Aminay]